MYIDIASSNSSAGTQPKLQRASGHARISLRLRHGKTRLERLFQEGCAKVRLPKTLPGDTAEAILINTAGGLTGGDRLATEIDLAAGTTATITTQACERIDRSTGGPATVSTKLRVASGGATGLAAAGNDPFRWRPAEADARGQPGSRCRIGRRGGGVVWAAGNGGAGAAWRLPRPLAHPAGGKVALCRRFEDRRADCRATQPTDDNRGPLCDSDGSLRRR